jgi:hypothetical protein
VARIHLSDPGIAAILEAVPDAIVCVTAGGRIAWVNGHGEALFGYPQADLAGQPVELLVPEAARGRHQKYRSGYLADPAPRPMGIGLQLSGRRRDGSTFPAEIALASVNTEDGMLVVGVVRDLTGRLAAEAEREQLRARAEQARMHEQRAKAEAEQLRTRMERDRLIEQAAEAEGEQRRAETEQARLANQLGQAQRLESLGQLAGGVAHDFNNLLGVISSYASFIREEVTREPAHIEWQPVRDDIDQVSQAAQRAAGLTQQLLDFARRRVIEPRPLNLNEVIAGLKPLLTRTLGEHVQLTAMLAPDLGTVLADPGQIEQVLVNLAVNARDAMPAGGQLTIETAIVDVTAPAAAAADLEPGRYASVKVSDSGDGIPPDVIDRVFEPFFTTKPEGRGSGLGLATVYGVVTQAGGDVRIYSRRGLGTTVTVLLPVTSGASAAPAPASTGPVDGHGEVVLIVEDEAALREVTRRMLHRHGYLVLAAASGPEALELAASRPEHIDLLLTDVVMPHMQGTELADRIRASKPGIRVLFMSGYAPGFLGAEGALTPGIRLIEKPFAEAALLTKLREVLAEPA